HPHGGRARHGGDRFFVVDGEHGLPRGAGGGRFHRPARARGSRRARADRARHGFEHRLHGKAQTGQAERDPAGRRPGARQGRPSDARRRSGRDPAAARRRKRLGALAPDRVHDEPHHGQPASRRGARADRAWRAPPPERRRDRARPRPLRRPAGIPAPGWTPRPRDQGLAAAARNGDPHPWRARRADRRAAPPRRHSGSRRGARRTAQPDGGACMKLVNFSLGNGAPRAGLLADGQVFEAPRPTVQELLADLGSLRTTGKGIPVSEVTLHAPLLYPGAIYCAGANYADHVAEMARAQNLPPPQDPRTLGLKPWFFMKPPRACVVGPRSRVARPRGSQKLDWEAELVAVIGKPARNVPVEKALDYVAGYTIADDLSARDLSRRNALPPGNPFHFDWTAHKGFEGSCPLGPWITPAA